MTGLILHHHNPSPFAEKIRKIFGVKNLPWKSCQVSMVMPRPDMIALTGGYRKIPVLQIGADIYCDTFLIAQILDRLYPEPPLFASGLLSNMAMQSWSDFMFRPGACLSLYENAENLPQEVSDDRADYFTFMEFENFEKDAPHFRSQFRAKAGQLEAQLADGRDYLLGKAPEWADLNAYANIYMAHGNIPSAERMFEPYEKMHQWYERMSAIGVGDRSEISTQDALAIARDTEPKLDKLAIDRDDECGLTAGDKVAVAPDDYGIVPVAGELRHISDRQISIIRDDPQAGKVGVHFPREGFRIERVS